MATEWGEVYHLDCFLIGLTKRLGIISVASLSDLWSISPSNFIYLLQRLGTNRASNGLHWALSDSWTACEIWYSRRARIAHSVQTPSCGLDDRGIGVLFPTGRDFCHIQSVQTISRSGVKGAGVWSQALACIDFRSQYCMDLYVCPPYV